MRLLIFSLLLCLNTYTFAQSDCACCSVAYQQFDFWLGKWTVTDTSGKLVGKNTIKKLEENCLITESWEGTSGSSGSSMNFFDKKDSSWNQVWIDNQGGVLRLKGRFEKGKMVLKSKIQKGQKSAYYNQISWKLNSNGTVTQIWETYSTSGKLLNTLFNGIYTKVE